MNAYTKHSLELEILGILFSFTLQYRSPNLTYGTTGNSYLPHSSGTKWRKNSAREALTGVLRATSATTWKKH